MSLNYYLHDLVARLRALKEKGSRVFQLWAKVQYWKHQANVLQVETMQRQSELEYARKELEVAHQSVRELSMAPKISPDKLLREAAYLLSRAGREPKPVNLYELRSWQYDYLEYMRDKR